MIGDSHALTNAFYKLSKCLRIINLMGGRKTNKSQDAKVKRATLQTAGKKSVFSISPQELIRQIKEKRSIERSVEGERSVEEERSVEREIRRLSTAIYHDGFGGPALAQLDFQSPETLAQLYQIL